MKTDIRSKVRAELAALGIPRGTYYRWLQEEAWAKEGEAANQRALHRGDLVADFY